MGEEEVYEKIETEHRNGAHLTGPQAGCRLCAERVAEQAPAIGDVSSADAIAELARKQAVGRDAPGRPLRTVPELPSEEEIASWGERGEPTLGDVALQDAQQALDVLKDGNYALAQTYAQIGMVRAFVGLDETLQRLLFALDADDEGITVLDQGGPERPPFDDLSEDEPPDDAA